MNYQNFMKLLAEELQARLPEGSRVRTSQVRKLNGVVLDSLTVDDGRRDIFPTLYFKELYEMHENGATMEELTDRLEDFFLNAKAPDSIECHKLMSFDAISDKICCKLINTEKNRELLANAPHVDFLDLSVVFYVLLASGDGISQVMITDDVMETWGKCIDDITKLACENTRRINKEVVESMGDFIRKSQSFQLEEADDYGRLSEFYIISGDTGRNGAIYMLDHNTLGKLADKLGDDLLIIPSSINELFIVPLNDKERSGVDAIVKEVNATELEETDYLSDHTYVYSRKEKKVMM